MTASNRLRVNKRRNGTKVVVGHQPPQHVPDSKGPTFPSSEQDHQPDDHNESLLDCAYMNQDEDRDLEHPYIQLDDSPKPFPEDDLPDLNI